MKENQIKTSVPKMRTVTNAAKETGLSEYTIRRLAKEGKIVHIKSGKKLLINLDKLIDFLEEGEPVETTKRKERYGYER